ncbi:leucine--tRNA ligase [Candidatus Peregrinibacteria bacterium]|nr:leucine--tRNA ligase [Candidatus Peregrinibacteria bacterium]
MPKKYQAPLIEKKWQRIWEEQGLFKTEMFSNKKQKYYCLVMFPYPSGDKLHVGHWYNYGGTDTFARFMRMKGHNVFEPMGFDAFGLPAENYAIKSGVHPAKSTAKNISYMRKQLRSLGAMYDWEKEVVTCDPEYYKWTQWLFLQFYKKGLAYRTKAPVNWCPHCQTVLANEQVQNGICERCGTAVTKKDLTQWFFKIRDYADRLLDFKGLTWPEKTKSMQEHWIGRKEGINIRYRIKDSDKEITVFTTRPDTNFGATFVVIAPEHPLVDSLTTMENEAAVHDYIQDAKSKSEIERMNDVREKTGVFTGSYAINDLTGYEMPVYVADYVLMDFGTGVVVGVPGHDRRDFEFANKFSIPIIRVIQGIDGNTGPIDSIDKVQEDDGIMVHSEFLNGLHPTEAISKMMDYIEKKGFGKRVINYRLKDWLLSRQRYWGCPIPIVYCKSCGEVPVSEKDLPVLLPEKVNYLPKGDERSPLGTSKQFVHTTCPKCGESAEREVDTMDTFVCSSWYFLRYPSSDFFREIDSSKKGSKQTHFSKNTHISHNVHAFDQKLTKKWLPVDMYIGGAEHACMHLLYARFFTKVLHDLGYIDFEEPFTRLVHQGIITKNSAKMSKSRGNVVSPDAFVKRYGSDVFRMYLLFMGPFTEGGDWDDRGITGLARFIEKVYTLITQKKTDIDDPEMLRLIHKTIRKVGFDIERFQFNTAIAALMECTNMAYKKGLSRDSAKFLVKLLAPLAPHFSEEMWGYLGGKFSVFDAPMSETAWPQFDSALAAETEVELVIQVNGKVRGRLMVSVDISKEEAISQVKEVENVKRYIEGKTIRKEIYVPKKLVNIVV